MHGDWGCTYLWRQEESRGSPGTGVAGGWELPRVDARNRI